MKNTEKKEEKEVYNKRVEELIKIIEESTEKDLLINSDDFKKKFGLHLFLIDHLSFKKDTNLSLIFSLSPRKIEQEKFVAITNHLMNQDFLLQELNRSKDEIVSSNTFGNIINSLLLSDLEKDKELLEKLANTYLCYLIYDYLGYDKINYTYFTLLRNKKHKSNYLEDLLLSEKEIGYNLSFYLLKNMDNSFNEDNITFFNKKIKKLLFKEALKIVNNLLSEKGDSYYFLIGIQIYLQHFLNKDKVIIENYTAKQLFFLKEYCDSFLENRGITKTKIMKGIKNILEKKGLEDKVTRNQKFSELIQSKVLDLTDKSQVIDHLLFFDLRSMFLVNEFTVDDEETDKSDYIDLIFQEYTNSRLLSKEFILKILEKYPISIAENSLIFSEEEVEDILKNQSDKVFLGKIHPYIPSNTLSLTNKRKMISNQSILSYIDKGENTLFAFSEGERVLLELSKTLYFYKALFGVINNRDQLTLEDKKYLLSQIKDQSDKLITYLSSDN